MVKCTLIGFEQYCMSARYRALNQKQRLSRLFVDHAFSPGEVRLKFTKTPHLKCVRKVIHVCVGDALIIYVPPESLQIGHQLE